MKTPFIFASDPVELNEGRPVTKLTVKNTGDRPVQVGSHYHFFEVNRMLEFDREKAWGQRMNTPSAATVRFEPGDEKDIELVPYAGKRIAVGFAGLANGPLDEDGAKEAALEAARQQGYKGA